MITTSRSSWIALVESVGFLLAPQPITPSSGYGKSFVDAACLKPPLMSSSMEDYSSVCFSGVLYGAMGLLFGVWPKFN